MFFTEEGVRLAMKRAASVMNQFSEDYAKDIDNMHLELEENNPILTKILDHLLAGASEGPLDEEIKDLVRFVIWRTVFIVYWGERLSLDIEAESPSRPGSDYKQLDRDMLIRIINLFVMQTHIIGATATAEQCQASKILEVGEKMREQTDGAIQRALRTVGFSDEDIELINDQTVA